MPFPPAITAHPPFSVMTEDDLETLWQAGVVRVHETGEAFTANVLSADALHILLDGTVSFGDAVDPVSAPGLLAESGCVLLPFEENVPFLALSKARTFSLSKAAFDTLLDQGAGAAFVILDHLVAKTTGELRELNGAVQDLLRQSET